jgi:uncharacterized protein YjiS (DUF1127 family)
MSILMDLITRPLTGTGVKGTGVKGRNRSLLWLLLREYRHRKAAETLRCLPDYLLKDIGIYRCEIDAVVRGEYPRGRQHRRGR